MTVDWAGYEPFEPKVALPYHQMTAREAATSFDETMGVKDERKAQLAALLERNGRSAATDDGSIEAINDWIVANVEPAPDDPERPRNLWLAATFDLGLFIGDVVIARNPGLRWRLFKGKRAVSTNKHVIMGFRVPNPRYNVDPDRFVATILFGSLPLGCEPSPLRLVDFVNGAARFATRQ